MFFSTNSSTKNGHDPFYDPDHSFDDHLPISFFPFPSPFEVDDHHNQFDFQYDDHLFFHDDHNFISTSTPNNNYNSHSHSHENYNILSIPPIIPADILDKIPSTNSNSNTTTTTMAGIINNSDENKMKKKIPRKRLSKKDRHSKITTARGLRDRRMRLSLAVARQFFGLQDMLGVDKGSKTVEWLLIQAGPAILELAKQRNCCPTYLKTCAVSSSNHSNSSQGDNMLSGITFDEVEVGVETRAEENSECFLKKNKSLKKDIKNKKRVKQPRKIMANKELRKLARARARERTLEKKNLIIIRDSSVISDLDHHHHHHHPNDNNFTKISSCSWSSQIETGEESAGTHSQSYNNNILNPAIEVEKPMTSQFDYQFQKNSSSSFEIMAKWSPSDSTFNYLHQIETLDDLQEQHEFEDSEIFG